MTDSTVRGFNQTPPDGSGSLFHKTARAIKPVLIFGLGLHWVWMCAFFYSAFPSLMLTNPVFSFAQYPLGTVLFVFFIIVTFGMGAVSDRITFFIRRRRFQVAVAIVFSVSTACVFLSNEFLPLPLLAFAEAAGGLASGFLLLLWCESYRRREPLAILTNSVLSVTFGFIVFRFTMFLLSPSMASVLFTVIPLLEVVFLYLALHGGRAFTQPQQFTVTAQGTKIAAPGLLEVPTYHKLKVQRGKFFIRIGIPFLFFGMVLKLLCDQVFRSATEPSYLTTAWSDFLVSTILPCFIMLVIAVIFIVTNQPDDCEQYYRYIIPVASIFVLLASLEWIGGIGEAFTSTSYLCLEFMLWMELCVISHRYRISPILVAGFGRGAMAVGMLCIGAVTAMPLGLAPVLESGIGHTFMLVMLVVGYSLLPREKDIRAMAVLDPVDEDTEPLSKGVRTGGLSSEDEKQKRENRFIVRCQRIANMFLLSPREMEVFLLLAKGRNTAYISKALFISEGTVHTHTRRIYKKLDIHRQQELIDMVDASYANAAQSKTNIDRAS